MILGVDEAGRGPWAGPLVVGAVVLGGAQIDGLTDSKKLTKKRREALYGEVVERAVAHASGWVSATELDEVGMSEALRLATRRAIEQIDVAYSEIIIDGLVNFLADTGKGRYAQVMKKADLLVPSVSAASIVAKVERDRYMVAMSEEYPEYGFGSHAGYGVAKHREAIAKLGVTPEHRLSFAPLQKYRGMSPLHPGPVSASDQNRHSPKNIGDQAETAVAEFLQSKGHEIVERNWRTKFCEIDIVSHKDGTIYFTEVKYRKKPDQGGGMAAITPKKLRQMRFAAEFYALKHAQNFDLLLAAASVTGDDFRVEEWIAVV